MAAVRRQGEALVSRSTADRLGAPSRLEGAPSTCPGLFPRGPAMRYTRRLCAFHGHLYGQPHNHALHLPRLLVRSVPPCARLRIGPPSRLRQRSRSRAASKLRRHGGSVPPSDQQPLTPDRDACQEAREEASKSLARWLRLFCVLAVSASDLMSLLRSHRSYSISRAAGVKPSGAGSAG
jgi:hypothetical protein